MNKTWDEARQFCIQEGGELASLTNLDEQKNITINEAYIKGGTKEKWWIGLSQLLNKRWSWSDGSKSTWTNWHKAEPNGNNTNKTYCVHLRDYKWHDSLCTVKRYFICKIPGKSSK